MNSGSAGRAEQVRCADFMASHSEYVDGVLSPWAAARLRAHAGTCCACARYDRVVRQGMDLIQRLPEIEPSPEFEQRLQHRIFHVQDAALLEPQRPGAGAAVTLGVAAMIALLAWSPLVLQRDTAPSQARVSVTPSYVPLGVGSPQARHGADWYATIPVLARPAGNTVLLTTSSAALPGPYSPLVVHPPMRAVRTVSRGSPE